MTKSFAFVFAVSLLSSACTDGGPRADIAPVPESATRVEITKPTVRTVLDSALSQTETTRGYTQQYFVIGYPDGDVPRETGACTDVIIRSLRSAGIDLQKEVHDDMVANFSAYPKKWGLTTTDRNIDHRRVPNLQTYFTRRGKSLGISSDARDYMPGDIVSWDLDGKGTTHIGIVSDLWSEETQRYLIIHNIGGGVNAEDRLFDWKVTGRFRYF